MKTLEELKQMHFIPHHECACCGSMVGWHDNGDLVWFDTSCGCGEGGGHYDSWEAAFRWYNAVFEHESDDEIQSAWEKECSGGIPG